MTLPPPASAAAVCWPSAYGNPCLSGFGGRNAVPARNAGRWRVQRQAEWSQGEGGSGTRKTLPWADEAWPRRANSDSTDPHKLPGFAFLSS